MSRTGIIWTNRTWNPVVGCTHVSAGCDHCYADALHTLRYRAWHAGKQVPIQYREPFTTVQVLRERFEMPLHWRQPSRIFVNSMADLFHSQVPIPVISELLDVMRRCPQHTFQILTKRAGRLRHLGPWLDWPPNVWMGVSIEHDQLTPRADALRIGAARAAVRFISAEPLLGPLPSLNLAGIDWLITGGESGPDARPLNLDWVRDLRDRCVATGVAFFHKQHGGRTPKSNGRELDGRTWDDYPEGVAA